MVGEEKEEKLKKELGFDDNLGLKILPPEEAAWEKIREAAEKDIDNYRRGIIISEAIVKTAKLQSAKLKASRPKSSK